ncbi:MAG: Zn-dependent exopeptidase M28, partial [bacterium]|nr:Zn-dependent exopeptidase M28 [bacterium]
HLSVRAEARESTAINVAGYIPGSDPLLKDEFIILCAHLDHCGHQPMLTPGAGDNASGSAVIIALARALAAYPGKFNRSILFVLFDAEEMGILGARHFVSRLPEPVKRIRFVLNLDQVAAGPDMFILRMKNYPQFESLVKEVHQSLALKSKLLGNIMETPMRGGADHSAFVAANIPAVSIFSYNGEQHGEHTNEDTIYWITPKIMEDIARLVGHTAIRLAEPACSTSAK